MAAAAEESAATAEEIDATAEMLADGAGRLDRTVSGWRL